MMFPLYVAVILYVKTLVSDPCHPNYGVIPPTSNFSDYEETAKDCQQNVTSSLLVVCRMAFEKGIGRRKYLNPIQARLFLPFKGPRGSLGTPL